ncbi:hypothetical protein [Vibrio coralliilyticus]|uniref:Uncharacterized protein n=1 Tax=Vibrio coralliilyticus TaxID=190893 RepID=A0AAP6ZRG7_9VIBR|nr:hypothetical protein [Vibrio coralliilyticus]NOI31852.1 hypothetical protein [Vibrio coralliilyticus]NOJ25296.1 hypothetical protein [Vibrio coralliilyticus]
MISKSNQKNLSEAIGDLVSSFINETEQENEQIEKEVTRSSKLLTRTIAISFLAILSAFFFVPEQYHSSLTDSSAQTISSSEVSSLREMFSQDYTSLESLIVEQDYWIAKSELVEKNASIEESYTKCGEHTCTQTITTKNIQVSFVSHDGQFLYIAVSKR